MCGRKEPVNHPRSWPLYVCYIFVLLKITSVFVSSTFLASGIILKMLFLIFTSLLQKNCTKCQATSRHHSCLASPSLHCHLLQCRYYGVTQSTQQTYQLHVRRSESLSIVLLLFQHYSHTCFISNSTVHLCVDKSQSVFYKTLNVYLATICLMHTENGFIDQNVVSRESKMELLMLVSDFMVNSTLKNTLRYFCRMHGMPLQGWAERKKDTF